MKYLPREADQKALCVFLYICAILSLWLFFEFYFCHKVSLKKLLLSQLYEFNILFCYIAIEFNNLGANGSSKNRY